MVFVKTNIEYDDKIRDLYNKFGKSIRTYYFMQYLTEYKFVYAQTK